MKYRLNHIIQSLRSAYQKADPETDNAWQRLRLKINQRSIITAPSYQSRMIQWLQRPVAVWTMVMALILLASPFVYNSWQTVTVKTAYGETQTVLLPDSSTVKINSGSTVSYPRQFSNEKREITLSGEAFFDVKKAPIPFVIQSGDMKVKVLGTMFNVKHYSGQIEVAVTEGIVLVEQQDSAVIVEKGQRTKFGQNGVPTAPVELVHEYPGWLQNAFIFEETPLSEVCKEIYRRFNVEVKLSNPTLETITISGEIRAGDLEEVLTTLSFLIQRKYIFKNNYYVIY